MFEALETNDILVELSLANTGMTDTAASVLAKTLGRFPILSRTVTNLPDPDSGAFSIRIQGL